MKKFVKRRFLPFLAVLVVLIGALAIPIGAEIDWTQYPTSNLLKFPYYNTTTVMDGIKFTVNPDGSVTMKGTATSNVEFWLCTFYKLKPDVYSISFNGAASDNFYLAVNFDRPDGSYSHTQDFQPSGKFALPGEGWTVGIRFFIRSGYTVNGTYYPMLNRGPQVYPFQPYLPKLIDDSFNEGKLAGIDESSSIDLFIEQASSVTFIFDIGSSNSSLHPVTPQSFTFNQNQIRNAAWYSNGTINVSYFVHQEDLIDNSFYIKSFRLNVEWPDILNTTNYNFVLSGAFGGNISVGVSAQSGVFLPNHLVIRGYDPLRQSEYYQVPFASGVDFSYFSVNVVPPDGYTNINTIGGSFYGSSLNDTLISFVANGTYSEGYASGYYDALSSVDSSHLIDEAYSNGYNTGFSVGKNEGLSIAQEGTFLNLMTSVVDAPVSVFSQMFDFELLGVNMLTFAKSILTLCLCVAIVRFFV